MAENNGAPKKDPERTTFVKWWEQYYVRYFVGTMVGIVIIFALREHAYLACEFRKIVPAFETIDVGKFAALAAGGLAYCYIASAPILTLHSIRGDWSEGAIPLPTIATPAPITGSAGVITPTPGPTAASAGLNTPIPAPTTAAAGVIAPAPSAAATSKLLPMIGGIYGIVGIGLWCLLLFDILNAPCTTRDSYFALAALTILLVSQMLFVFRAVRNRLSRIITFYDNLATERTREWIAQRDYLDSYRHLREHGNAFAIVTLELSLGIVLAVLQTGTQLVVTLLVWMLPATFSWFTGSVLEAALANRK